MKYGFAPATHENRPEDRDLIPGLFLKIVAGLCEAGIPEVTDPGHNKRSHPLHRLWLVRHESRNSSGTHPGRSFLSLLPPPGRWIARRDPPSGVDRASREYTDGRRRGPRRVGEDPRSGPDPER